MAYLRSVFLSLVFLAAIVAWSQAQSLFLSWMGIAGNPDWAKLLALPGFLLGTGLVALMGGRLPALGHPFRNYPRAYLSILFLPVALNLAAIPLYNLSLRIAPPGDLFFELQRMLEPTGTLVDTAGLILTVTLVGPICEEFVFRGAGMEGLLRAGKNPHLVVWIQGFLFGAVHANPWQFLYAFAIGTLFGYLRLWTGGIGLTVALHILVNAVSMGSAWMQMDEFTGPSDGSPVQIHPLWPLLGWTGAAIACFPFFRAYRSYQGAA